MPAKVTETTYKEFIHQNTNAFNYDGTIYTDDMKRLIINRFGSSRDTVITHMQNLILLKLVREKSKILLQLNPIAFPDLVPKDEPKPVKRAANAAENPENLDAEAAAVLEAKKVEQ